jgi:hypothetical protein
VLEVLLARDRHVEIADVHGWRRNGNGTARHCHGEAIADRKRGGIGARSVVRVESRLLANAMRRPSGDHAGDAPAVMFTDIPVAASMTTMPPPLKYAIRVASGD